MEKKTRNMAIITLAGLVIGTAEALIYYNLGEAKADKKKKFTYKIPPFKELAQTTGIVFVTSILTAAITNGIEKSLDAIPQNTQTVNGLQNRFVLPHHGKVSL